MDRIDSIVPASIDEPTLIAMRSWAQQLNQLSYAQLQADQWTSYYKLGRNEGIWMGQVSRKSAQLHSLCQRYGRRKGLIQQRRTYFQRQIESFTEQWNKQISHVSPSSNHLELIHLVTTLVNNDQQPLRMELERRRTMLKFDAKDHQLVQAFYTLKPRHSEIHSAQVIWRTIDEEQKLRFEIALFQAWLSYADPKKFCSFEALELTRINALVTQVLFVENHLSNNDNNNTTTIDSNVDRNSLSIDEIARRTIVKAETLIETYLRPVKEEKSKLNINRKKFQKPPAVEAVFQAIEDRQQNMVQRAQYHVEQTLNIILQTMPK